MTEKMKEIKKMATTELSRQYACISCGHIITESKLATIHKSNEHSNYEVFNGKLLKNRPDTDWHTIGSKLMLDNPESIPKGGICDHCLNINLIKNITDSGYLLFD